MIETRRHASVTSDYSLEGACTEIAKLGFSILFKLTPVEEYIIIYLNGRRPVCLSGNPQ